MLTYTELLQKYQAGKYISYKTMWTKQKPTSKEKSKV